MHHALHNYLRKICTHLPPSCVIANGPLPSPLPGNTKHTSMLWRWWQLAWEWSGYPLHANFIITKSSFLLTPPLSLAHLPKGALPPPLYFIIVDAFALWLSSLGYRPTYNLLTMPLGVNNISDCSGLGQCPLRYPAAIHKSTQRFFRLA